MARKKKTLHDLVIDACRAVGPVTKRGHNDVGEYDYQRLCDVLNEFRGELFKRGILLRKSETKPEFQQVPTNGGGMQMNCCVGANFTLTNGIESLGPDTHYGEGQDGEGKALYKAKSGALKYYLIQLGLIPDADADPEFDGASEAEERNPFDEAVPARTAKKVTEKQIIAFTRACEDAGKQPDEISGYLLTKHKVASIAELGRGKPFTEAIVWASNGEGTLDPKPQAAPALQGSLALRTAPQPIEMKLGNKSITFEPKDRATFSV